MVCCCVDKGSSGSLVHSFKQSGRALASADAHGHYAIACFAARHLVGDSSYHAGTGHAERMANGDGSSVRIQLLRVQAEAITTVHHLHRKSFIQLPDINVAHFYAGALQQLGYSEHGTDSHLIR